MDDKNDMLSENSGPKPDEEMCRGCVDRDKCRMVWSEPNRGHLSAGGLVLASILVFLLPLLTAVLGGALMKGQGQANAKVSMPEIAGVASGLIIGVVLAWLGMLFIRKKFHVSRPKFKPRV